MAVSSWHGGGDCRKELEGDCRGKREVEGWSKCTNLLWRGYEKDCSWREQYLSPSAVIITPLSSSFYSCYVTERRVAIWLQGAPIWSFFSYLSCRVGGMAQNSPLSIHSSVMCRTESWTACMHSLYGFALTNPSCACRISSVCISKQELPQFPFSSPEKKKKRMREKVEEGWSTMGQGWVANKVDYDVFTNYLPGTRLSLVIILLLRSLAGFGRALWINCVWQWRWGAKCGMKLDLVRQYGALRILPWKQLRASRLLWLIWRSLEMAHRI